MRSRLPSLLMVYAAAGCTAEAPDFPGDSSSASEEVAKSAQVASGFLDSQKTLKEEAEFCAAQAQVRLQQQDVSGDLNEALEQATIECYVEAVKRDTRCNFRALRNVVFPLIDLNANIVADWAQPKKSTTKKFRIHTYTDYLEYASDEIEAINQLGQNDKPLTDCHGQNTVPPICAGHIKAWLRHQHPYQDYPARCHTVRQNHILDRRFLNSLLKACDGYRFAKYSITKLRAEIEIAHACEAQMILNRAARDRKPAWCTSRYPDGVCAAAVRTWWQARLPLTYWD